MQARPELSDGFKERQIACLEGTMGFHVAWMVHIYLYAASRLWDTDRISRLRRLPLEAARHNPFWGRTFRCQREDRSSGSRTRALVEDSIGRPFGGKARRIIPEIVEKGEPTGHSLANRVLMRYFNANEVRSENASATARTLFSIHEIN